MSYSSLFYGTFCFHIISVFSIFYIFVFTKNSGHPHVPFQIPDPRDKVGGKTD